MGIKCGIVGLPNVGKSTLFNALTRTAAAQAANYPFCTIEPNTGDVAVPDARLSVIAKIGKSANIIPTRISFVDIAGLVRGASKGEGLGNQFLANIREVDAIIHVLRCFEDDDITHVEGKIDPVADADTVETELMLADLESIERRIVPMRKKAGLKDAEAGKVLPVMEEVLALLTDGKPARLLLKTLDVEGIAHLKGLNLLTSHPVLYVCNVIEAEAATGNAHTTAAGKMAASQGAGMVIISANIEAEVAQLPDEDAKEFLGAMGLEEPGLDKLIHEAYRLLGLATYFTVGPKEARAWTIHKGMKAPQAAGVIHSDFEHKFIRAQTIAFDDFVSLGGEVAAKEAGKARDEGKEYVVKDGDVMLFKTGA